MFGFFAFLLRIGAGFRRTSTLFFRGMVYLCLTVGLLWVLGITFPEVARALGHPCNKVWECVSAASSSVLSSRSTPTPIVITTAPAPARAEPNPQPQAASPNRSEWEETQNILNESWGKDWDRTVSTLQ